MVRSLTSRSNLSLVQIRNQSFTISCLSDSREDTGQTSLCGFKLLTTNNIMLNYEHPWDIRQNGRRDKIDTLHDIEQIICKKAKADMTNHFPRRYKLDIDSILPKYVHGFCTYWVWDFELMTIIK